MDICESLCLDCLLVQVAVSYLLSFSLFFPNTNTYIDVLGYNFRGTLSILRLMPSNGISYH